MVILVSSLVLLYGQAFSKSYLYRIEELYLIGLFFFGLVLAFFIGNFRVLNNPALTFIGKHSYPIYLFHILLVDCFDWVSKGVPMLVSPEWIWLIIRYLVVLIVSIVLSVISVKYVEYPVIKFLERNR